MKILSIFLVCLLLLAGCAHAKKEDTSSGGGELVSGVRVRCAVVRRCVRDSSEARVHGLAPIVALPLRPLRRRGAAVGHVCARARCCSKRNGCAPHCGARIGWPSDASAFGATVLLSRSPNSMTSLLRGARPAARVARESGCEAGRRCSTNAPRRACIVSSCVCESEANVGRSFWVGASGRLCSDVSRAKKNCRARR